MYFIFYYLDNLIMKCGHGHEGFLANKQENNEKPVPCKRAERIIGARNRLAPQAQLTVIQNLILNLTEQYKILNQVQDEVMNKMTSGKF